MFNRLLTALERIADELALLRADLSAKKGGITPPSVDDMKASADFAKEMMKNLLQPKEPPNE